MKKITDQQIQSLLDFMQECISPMKMKHTLEIVIMLQWLEKIEEENKEEKN